MSQKAAELDEKKWQARSDAHTLAEAKTIMGDPERMKGAQKAAKELADEIEQQAKEAGLKADAMNDLAAKMYPTMSGNGSGEQDQSNG